jgi:hypothetical protein
MASAFSLVPVAMDCYVIGRILIGKMWSGNS